MKITTVDEIPRRTKRSKFDDDIDDVFEQVKFGKKLRINAIEPGFLPRLRIRRKIENLDIKVTKINEEVYLELREKPSLKRPKSIAG